MLAIIINPKSGKKAYLRQRYYLFRLLEERDETYIYRVTRYAGHATELARELAEQGHRRFLILGGDGTVSEAIQGLMTAQIADREQIQFGIMPRGTGNDYGRCWNLTKDYQESLRRFFEGKAQPVDIGQITYYRNGEAHNKYFVNSVGYGIDAKTCAWTHTLKYYLGSHHLLYAVALIAAVWSHEPQNLELTIHHQGETEVCKMPVFTMNIGNGPYSGGGIRQTPDANPTDGIFHAMVATKPTFMDIMRAIPVLFNGGLAKLSFIRQLTAETITIKAPEMVRTTARGGEIEVQGHMPFEADGLLTDACAPMTVTCLHHALQIVC